MEKLFFKEAPKAAVHSEGTKRSSTRDRSDISSRWNEVTAQKESSERSVERKGHDPERQCSDKKLADSGSECEALAASQSGEESAGSPLELFQNIARKRKHLSKVKGDPKQASLKGEEKAEALSASEYRCCGSKEKKEQPIAHDELAQLNPLAEGVTIAVADGMTEGVIAYTPTISVADVEALIHKIVDEVQLMTQDGRTETTITIKNSSTFADVKVTITEFDTAKKEFNITFQNLTQRAHEIVSMQQNREALKSALEQKGYLVHIITATTEIEEPAPTYKGEQERNGGEKHDQQQQEQQQQHQQQQ